MSKKVLFISVLIIFSKAYAHDWSLGVGYNNPPGSTIGINMMKLWSNWAFEFGVGQVSSSSNNNNSSNVSIIGDLNFKYIFNGNVFRPYLQFGAGSSVSVNSGSNTTAGAGIGGGFGGVGFFLMGNPFYLYLSVNGGNGSSFFQAGLGFDL